MTSQNTTNNNAWTVLLTHTKPNGTQEVRLVDATLLHTLNTSHLKESTSHQKAVLEGERAHFFDNIPDPTAKTVHPILRKAQTNKHVTYKPVINKANVSNSNFNTKTNLKIWRCGLLLC